MTHDTEWPAAEPHCGQEQAATEAGWLAWCIRYLANEARRSGFEDTAAALDAAAPIADGDERPADRLRD
ncbi:MULTISPECIES: hypothetical protein [Alphaproteobacteria]|uniref:Uncharacterized protein n=1 Tax=Pannonibacter phragmitetus TaxID=121719 RepID=A0A0U3N800_9HYPH|nr:MULTISPECIES: hypothetical protein [Alphaproteobacteria]ALV27403.1 hypothetical protein APZ00_10310 [Pannonibacter phragmitetus]